MNCSFLQLYKNEQVIRIDYKRLDPDPGEEGKNPTKIEKGEKFQVFKC
jgi:hypothetical protein